MALLSLDDVTLHYQAVGDGDDLVLIHGLGANLAFWYIGIARPLARRFRVITYDLRGHGRSAMPRSGYRLGDMSHDLGRLLDHLGSRRVHLVGHSHGARVALLYAALHPGRVRTLTLADTQIRSLQPLIRLREWPHWPAWKRQLAEAGFTTLPGDDEVISYALLAKFNEASHDIALGRPLRRPRAPSLRHRDMGRKGGAKWAALMRRTTARRDFELEDELTPPLIRSVAVPTLALYGAYSHCVPTAVRLEALMPDCRRVMVPGAGHFHPAVKPRRFARVLGRFLSLHAADRGDAAAGDVVDAEFVEVGGRG